MRIRNQCPDPKASQRPLMWGGTSHTATKVQDGWRIDYVDDVAVLPPNDRIDGTMVNAMVDGALWYLCSNLLFPGTGSKTVSAWLQCAQAEWPIIQAAQAGCFDKDSAPY